MKNVRAIDADAMREDWLTNGENEYVYDTNAVLESIDAQPTIEVPTWIPVTERLPADGANVLAYRRSMFGGQVFPATYKKLEWHDCIMDAPRSNVTHWMPIPKPPRR